MHFYYIFFIDEWYKYLIKNFYQTELKPVWFKAAPWLTPMYSLLTSVTVDQRAAGSNQIGIKADIF